MNAANTKICLKYRPGLSSRKNCFIRVSHKCHFESTMRLKKMHGTESYTLLPIARLLESCSKAEVQAL